MAVINGPTVLSTTLELQEDDCEVRIILTFATAEEAVTVFEAMAVSAKANKLEINAGQPDALNAELVAQVRKDIYGIDNDGGAE